MSDIIMDENIFCEFKPTEEKDKFICSLCDTILKFHGEDTEGTNSDLPLIPCSVKLSRKENENILPSITKRIRNFFKSLYHHVINGAKRTSPKERNRRLEICSKCEYYDGKVCLQCGCPILRQANFISKLDWKEQHCPINKW
jgi:hypothetical protein